MICYRKSSSWYYVMLSVSLTSWLLFSLKATANEETADVDRLVQQLGSDRFREREAAMATLRRIGKPALPLLRKALKSRDPEVRRRAKDLIDHISPEANNIRPIPKRLRPLRTGGAIYHYDNRFPNKPLVSVDLSSCRLDDDDLIQLRGKEYCNLTSLLLTGPQLTNATLAHIEVLTDLSALSLNSTSVTDVTSLRKLSKLTTLNLNHTKITDAGLAPLKDLSDLGFVSLYDTKITDAGLAHLKGLKKMWILQLTNTKITDKGLVHLEGMPNLWCLDLSGTGITDAGLVHLKGLKKLRFLDVSGTKVTTEGYAELKRSLPELDKDK